MQPFNRVLGVDPGYTGAAVLAGFNNATKCTEFQVIEFKNYTYKLDKLKTKVIDYGELIADLGGFVFMSDAAAMENVKAMPKDGGTSAFNFGYFTGLLRGVVETYHRVTMPIIIPVFNPTPQVWKSDVGLKTHADKKDSVQLAEMLFPDFKHNFYGPRGGIKDGVAEAALLSAYGLKQLYEAENG